MECTGIFLKKHCLLVKFITLSRFTTNSIRFSKIFLIFLFLETAIWMLALFHDIRFLRVNVVYVPHLQYSKSFLVVYGMMQGFRRYKILRERSRMPCDLNSNLPSRGRKCRKWTSLLLILWTSKWKKDQSFTISFIWCIC